MLVLLMAATATIFMIMMMQVDKIKEPAGRLFSFTTIPNKAGDSLVFEVWAHDYTHALKMAYKYRITHIPDLNKKDIVRWAKITELDIVTREVIDVIIDRSTDDVLVIAETKAE